MDWRSAMATESKSHQTHRLVQVAAVVVAGEEGQQSEVLRGAAQISFGSHRIETDTHPLGRAAGEEEGACSTEQEVLEAAAVVEAPFEAAPAPVSWPFLRLVSARGAPAASA